MALVPRFQGRRQVFCSAAVAGHQVAGEPGLSLQAQPRTGGQVANLPSGGPLTCPGHVWEKTGDGREQRCEASKMLAGQLLIFFAQDRVWPRHVRGASRNWVSAGRPRECGVGLRVCLGLNFRTRRHFIARQEFTSSLPCSVTRSTRMVQGHPRLPRPIRGSKSPRSGLSIYGCLHMLRPEGNHPPTAFDPVPSDSPLATLVPFDPLAESSHNCKVQISDARFVRVSPVLGGEPRRRLRLARPFERIDALPVFFDYHLGAALS